MGHNKHKEADGAACEARPEEEIEQHRCEEESDQDRHTCQNGSFQEIHRKRKTGNKRAEAGRLRPNERFDDAIYNETHSHRRGD